jgi:hypothetical protein
MLVHSVNYGDAEARGRLRQWKQKLARDYAVFDNAYKHLSDGNLRSTVIDMVKCSRAGRKTAFEKIHRALGPGATLESVDLSKPRHSRAIWSILKPRDSVTIEVPDTTTESERESLSQNCVTVNYVLIGCVTDPEPIKAEGLWTLEVPDHALGRAVAGSGFLHPGTIIRNAHLHLLDLPSTKVDLLQGEQSALIKAGTGCFAGKLCISEDVSLGGHLTAFVHVKTWLDAKQLHKDQIILNEKGEPGNRLGDGVLLPRPLVRFKVVEGNKLQMYTLSK